jgi:hypothetical protein
VIRPARPAPIEAPDYIRCDKVQHSVGDPAKPVRFVDDLKLPGEEDTLAPLVEEALQRCNSCFLPRIGDDQLAVAGKVLVHRRG